MLCWVIECCVCVVDLLSYVLVVVEVMFLLIVVVCVLFLCVVLVVCVVMFLFGDFFGIEMVLVSDVDVVWFDEV